jgi:hypothetical protein
VSEMIWILSICTSPWMGLCSQSMRFQFPNEVECEAAKKDFPREALGSAGWSICFRQHKELEAQ